MEISLAVTTPYQAFRLYLDFVLVQPKAFPRTHHKIFQNIVELWCGVVFI